MADEIAGRTLMDDPVAVKAPAPTPLEGGSGPATLSMAPRPTAPPPCTIDGSIIVRLHFTEAMAVLIFNALDEKRQHSVKMGFQRLLARIENVATPEISNTIEAYRDTLRAMEAMLSSNPKPEELAVALSEDFAKRLRRPNGTL